MFNSGDKQLVRASTYGRGIWEFNLVIVPDFLLSVSNPQATIFLGQTATFNGFATAMNGYTSSVTLSCATGSTPPPGTCSPSPLTLTPVNKTPFTVTVGGAAGDYTFNVLGAGSDAKQIKHSVPLTLHVISFNMTTPTPANVNVSRGTSSNPVNFQITAAGSFNQSVAVSCNTDIPNGSCLLTPLSPVNPTSKAPVNMTASVTVPSETVPGSYSATIQANTTGAPTTLTGSFTLKVTSNPDFVLRGPDTFPEVNVGSTGTIAPLSVTAQDGFNGVVTLNCPATFGAGSCSISPTAVSVFPATPTLTINGTSFSAGSYTLSVTGTSGSLVHSTAVAFNVGDYSISGPQTISVVPGGYGTASLVLASLSLYSGRINATCDSSALSGATCALSSESPIAVASGGTTNLTATVSIPNNAAPGTYNIKIDTHDVSGAPSHSFTFGLGVADDFLVVSSTPSQTVTAGQTSGPYNFSVRPVGASFNGAVTLTCSGGLPAQAQCTFSPSGPVTPGNSAVDVVLSISTPARNVGWRSLTSQLSTVYAMWLLLPGIVIAWGSASLRRNATLPCRPQSQCLCCLC